MRTLFLALAFFNKHVQVGLMNVAALLIGIMTVCVFVGVFSRYVFEFSIASIEEVGRFMMIWMTFLVIPYAIRNGHNVSITFLQSSIKNARLKQLLHIFLLTFLLILLVFCSYEAILFFERGQNTLASTMNLPMGIVYIVAPVSLVFMIFSGLEMLLGHILELFGQKGGYFE